jgi:hypothetical protein
MKRKVDLALLLTEKDQEVALKVISGGKSILKFENGEAPAVRVIGFSQPALTREQLLEFAHHEAYGNDNGAVGVLEHYIHSRERDMFNHLLELRKIMRKLVKAVESANAAGAVARDLRAAQPSAQADGPASGGSAA